MQKRILVCGGAGFIGSHLAKRLKEEGCWVRVADIKDKNEYFEESEYCDEYIQADLRDPLYVQKVMCGYRWDEVYQMAADMGGATYIFTGEHDADIMYNSALINLNIAKEAIKTDVKRLFYSSSACMYPAYTQEDPNNPDCRESSAYPAAPDSEYGWEKLFSERLYKSFERNYGLCVKVARYHNIFGPYGIWCGGKEKSPAAICRKVAENDNTIDVFGDGKQTRSFLYIDECVEATIRLMRSESKEIVNIGSEEMITIGDLVKMIIDISGKKIDITYIPGPTGVRGRNSNNDLYKQEIGWAVSQPLRVGIEKLYSWIKEQVKLK